jgi:hypothetical protein
MARIYIDFWLCIAKYLAFDLAIVLSCVGFGLLCDQLLRPSLKNLERFFFRFVLGAGVWMLCMFAAGSVHILSKTTILVFFALSVVPILLKAAKKNVLSFSSIDWLTVGSMLLSFVASFWYSQYPARFYEDLNYHLPLAQFFLNTHSIDPAWHLRFPVGSQGTDLLFVPLQAFGGDIGAHQLSVVSFQMFLVGVYCCARRFGRSVQAGQIALLACLTGAHVLEMSVVAFIDMNFGLFVNAAIYAGLCFLDAGQNANRKYWAAISGICFGLSISSSLMGLVPFFVFVGLAFAEALVPKKDANKEVPVEVSGILLLVAAALLLSTPWFIRTFAYTHNPVFPLAGEFFGLAGIWNANDIRIYMDSLRENYGLSKDLFDVINLPWMLSFPPVYFFEPSLTPTLLLALILGVPLAFLPNSQTIRRLLILICAVILVWFFFGHHTTYLLGIVPAVSVLTGITLSRFWVYVTDRPTQKFLICFFTAVVLVFGAVGHSFAFLGKNFDPIPATAAIRSMLLNRWLPIHATFEFANKLPTGNLYTYRNPDVKYFYKGTTFGDHYGQARFDDFATAAQSSRTLVDFLRKFEIKYIVVEQKSVADLPKDEVFKSHFHQLYSDESAVLYQLD